MGDDDFRFASQRLRLTDGRDKLADIVPVAFEHVPAERFPLIDERFQLHHLFRAVIDLAVIPVNDRDEVVRFMVAGGHHRFPDLSLVELAVAEKYIDKVPFLIEPEAERTADGR